ncbi:MAG: ABC transporter ATP-binding protein [Bacilli bacterium]|nr:ABC transporter ATP-binding protein [Bacilli bacterium]
MLKLKKVSKFYYSKGMVATGFTKISLDFNIGEFVAITGESGSGKSTLLNVISGLDSYEEGEMFINGEETSHYSEKDYEIYRKKYIGNIFQNFNLITSYTVYQNVELVLLINGYKRKEVKDKVLNIIKEVGLTKYKNTKVSKLSGGQKQRVAIARCLAKETPVIIADEPTGNLDSKSAESVLKLLNEISKNKLVIVVTHNYEQVEDYVTRKITMHDGRVIEDTKLKETPKENTVQTANYKETTALNKLRLGIRNTFNIIPKFILLLMVYLFIVLSISGTYSSFQKGEYETAKEMYNPYFSNLNANKRIVLKKDNNEAFNEEDYEKIQKINNVDYILKDDLSYDREISVYNEYIYLYGSMVSIDLLEGKLDVGRMPENENEIVIYANENDWMISNMQDSIIDKEFQIEELRNPSNNEYYKVKIVGIKYKSTGYSTTYYVSNNMLENVRKNIYETENETTYTYANRTYTSQNGNINNEVRPNANVPKGEAYISSEKTYDCKYSKCINYDLNINSANKYFTNNLNLKITKEYNKNNMNKLLGLSYEENNGAVFINPEDYTSLFKGNIYQSSVFIKNDKLAKETENEIKALGYDTFYILDGVSEDIGTKIIRIAKLIVLSILIIVLFFISYFVIKLILKSRNVYFSTIRMLGSSSKTAKNLLDIELNMITNIAYVIFISLILIANNIEGALKFIKDLAEFLTIKEYIIIYIILIIMSYLTSTRYANKLFKKSAMTTIKERV